LPSDSGERNTADLRRGRKKDAGGNPCDTEIRRNRSTHPAVILVQTECCFGLCFFPSPLMGEGEGEGDSRVFPLTLILSPEGERRFFRDFVRLIGQSQTQTLSLHFV